MAVSEPKAKLMRVALAGWACILLAWGSGGCQDRPQRQPVAATETRLISLVPAITETLFAIGAGAQLVAVSQYCDRPAEAKLLPQVGTALTPSYEHIARLKPSLILTETNQSTKSAELQALAPTLELPWLSLSDIVSSTRLLGQRTHHAERANALAAELQRELSAAPPADAPRVLLVLGYTAGSDLAEVWFIRRNSVHGSALAAAGGRNAVDEDISGLPRLSLPAVLKLDPDQIIVLVAAKVDERASESAIIAAWKKLTPLKAVQHGRVATLEAPEAFGSGPSILQLKPKLKRLIATLREREP